MESLPNHALQDTSIDCILFNQASEYMANHSLPRPEEVMIDNLLCMKGYRVLTSEHKSLGLRRNPNILTYPVNEWFVLPTDMLSEGKSDWGGIWVTRRRSAATTLSRYMIDQYGIGTLTYTCGIGNVLYANSYRIKTDRIFLIDLIST